jgi:hypothetical protein
MVLRLVDEIKRDYEEKIEVEYDLKVSPAIIIDKDIRIIGVCPSKKTLKNAIREAGVI